MCRRISFYAEAPLRTIRRFGTLLSEPLDGFTSDREALPIRGEAPIRKGRGLSILQT